MNTFWCLSGSSLGSGLWATVSGWSLSCDNVMISGWNHDMLGWPTCFCCRQNSATLSSLMNWFWCPPGRSKGSHHWASTSGFCRVIKCPVVRLCPLTELDIRQAQFGTPHVRFEILGHWKLMSIKPLCVWINSADKTERRSDVHKFFFEFFLGWVRFLESSSLRVVVVVAVVMQDPPLFDPGINLHPDLGPFSRVWDGLKMWNRPCVCGQILFSEIMSQFGMLHVNRRMVQNIYAELEK